MQRPWTLAILLLACSTVARAQEPKQDEPPGIINSIAISVDGKLVLTGSSNKTATLWEVAGSKKLRSFAGHTDQVRGVALSSDARIALTGSHDRTAIVWDADTGKKLHTLQGHSDKITSVALSDDGKLALTGSEDKTAILWDAATGKKLHTLQGHTDKVMGVALNSAGTLALTASVDKTAILWDAAGKKFRTFTSKTPFYGVALSADGKVAFGAGAHERILWNPTAGNVLHSFSSASSYDSVALSGDGKRALTTTYNSVAGLWDTVSRKQIQSFENPNVLGGTSGTLTMLTVALSRDGKFALTSKYDSTVALWDTTTGNKLQSFPGSSAIDPQKPLQLLVDNHASIHSLSLSEDDKTMLVGYPWGAAVWDLGQGKHRHFLRRGKNNFNAAMGAAALSGNGKMAITTDDHNATLWDADNGKKLFELVGHTDFVRAVALSGKNIEASKKTVWALTGAQDGTAILWDATTGKKIQTFKGKDTVVRVALHDDFALLTGTLQGGAGLWGISSGGAMKGFRHKGAITGLAQGFDNKNAFVISAGGSGAVMWSKIDGKIIKTYQHPKVAVTCLHLSADLKHLVTGDRGGVAYLWDTATAKPIQTFNHGEFIELPGSKKKAGFVLRPGDDVTGVALTSDGKHLWTGTSAGSVRLWDVKSGKELCRLYCGAGDSSHWLVTTAAGHFDGSANAWKQVSYRVKGTATILDGDDTRKKMHRPGLLAEILEVKN